MATAPEKLLLRLEWRIVRRLDGRLQGAYRTVHRGTGIDFTGLRAYVEGDDARQIDWNVTARLDEPYLRVFTEDREVTVWLVLDRSASMTAGRPGRGKHEVLAELAIVLARMFTRAGNRVGALFFDTGILRVVPPGTSRRHVLRIAAELGRTARARGGATTDLGEMLDAAGRLARRRSLILVLSDFIGEGDWERALQRLARRHEVVALRIVDTADDMLPEAGLIVIEDAETGEQLIVDSADPLLRAGLRTAVDAREERLAAGMRRARVPLHRIDTDRDLTQALVEVVARTRSRAR
ncbi:hypothetical protein GCM10010106_30320 [Thermopolyspora flexuosa]|jgi:uncharacterized protein (DUF58 family)|uniref:Uncharacterized protein DUF58 n=1 Tax=Thermopolyspora flexuosa TaxID=103836 RepID=A0A543ISD5_9ACTN|nr:DUF58 domain-containing protein [Thermopolyspora flexuosa]TQM73491.1 uncharacterized protein DUF58 [Thermopolyspora flexuosa]GGM81613.1 hypothetical protein GCM10010106_30320 [Thermopolyspora flexuosa]